VANKISVAMCTYNGEPFLPLQLESIAKQTRLPDELVVCDDGSTDKTVALLGEFALRASFPVKIIQNEHKLGSSKNFEKAIGLCSGDFIALSDQDDQWNPTRLDRSEQELLLHAEAGLVFSDGDIVDDRDQLVGLTLWQGYGFSGTRKQRLTMKDYTVLVRNRFVTGATVMFRSCLRKYCLPIGPGWHHDEWIVGTAAGFADIRSIDEPLIRYRKHSLQQVGLGPKPSFVERKRTHWRELNKQIGMLQAMCDALSTQPLSESGKTLFSHYQEHLRFARLRCALPRRRLARIPVMLKQYSAYNACGTGLASIATDLVLSK
jgi:glycosyltransferase involved in cell wall biosynthesis